MLRVTRKKALVIANAACRAYERKQHVPGGMTLLLPEDYATCSPSGFRYVVVNRPDGTFVGTPAGPSSSGQDARLQIVLRGFESYWARHYPFG